MRRYFYLSVIFFLSLCRAYPAGFPASLNPNGSSGTVLDTFPVINTMIGMVDTTMVTAHVIHLQDYVTRFCTQQGSFDAQDWIKGQFEYFGLPVELQDFNVWLGESSDNVIATLQGDVYPDEYVILGGHYDSYASITEAPGADDNASGTCGVIEAARILSKYHFERSIVFCAFSAEELGLIGSDAYASRAQQEGMNILGYFNMDMIGYQEPGTPLHTDMIAPPSAAPLVQYYRDVAAIYLPGFPIEDGYLTGGDSDHTSFNNYGYMGIFPFEDDTLYSHYIHSSDDIVGLSYNSPLLAMKLIQAAIASVASMAVPVDNTAVPPMTERNAAVRVYPVPASASITIEVGSSGRIEADIYALTGSQVMSGAFESKGVFDISSLSPGTYLLRVTGKEFTATKKLVVN